MDKSTAIILDPEAATAARVGGENFEDGEDRVLITFEHPELDVRIGLLPDAAASYIVAMCNAMGLPTGDLEYLAERFMAEGFGA